MLIQTSNAKFLIESCLNRKDCVQINSTSKEELDRFFGSLEVMKSASFEFPYQITACKQEFANALIIMVKEIDYSDFSSLELHSV